MLGFDLIGMAKHEVLKEDFNHNGKPDILEALEAGEKACDTIAKFFSRFDASDVRTVLALLPSNITAKIPASEVVEVADAVVALPKALGTAKSVMESIAGALGK